ncbi:unnamed protein product [Linum trigynum]|uniref:Uncharacterized protein n=1 Tax=Linum trigynum TaxID=586398 RepID=A0AAV2GMQ0_9ROSI
MLQATGESPRQEPTSDKNPSPTKTRFGTMNQRGCGEDPDCRLLLNLVCGWVGLKAIGWLVADSRAEGESGGTLRSTEISHDEAGSGELINTPLLGVVWVTPREWCSKESRCACN